MALARTWSRRGDGGGAGGMTSSVSRAPKLPPVTRVPNKGGSGDDAAAPMCKRAS